MKRKTFISILLIATVFTILYTLFLFMPYFAETNKATGVVDKIVFGYQIGFGFKGTSSENIKGNLGILICQLGGMFASLTSIFFFIYYGILRKESKIMYLLSGLSFLGLSLAFTSICIAWPVYQNLNATKDQIAQYSWEYFFTLATTGIALIINGFVTIYCAINKKGIKENETSK